MVLDRGERPVRGAIVCIDIEPSFDGEWPASLVNEGVSDTSGNLLVPLPGLDDIVGVSGARAQLRVVAFAPTMGCSGDVSFDAPPAGGAAAVTVRLKHSRAVVGRVVSHHGIPVRGARVSQFRDGPETLDQSVAITYPGGQFCIPIRDSDAFFHAVEPRLGAARFSATVPLQSCCVDVGHISLVPTCRLFAQILSWRGSPLAGCSLLLRRQGEDADGLGAVGCQVTTDDQGWLRLNGMRPGQYRVLAGHDEFLPTDLRELGVVSTSAAGDTQLQTKCCLLTIESTVAAAYQPIWFRLEARGLSAARSAGIHAQAKADLARYLYREPSYRFVGHVGRTFGVLVEPGSAWWIYASTGASHARDMVVLDAGVDQRRVGILLRHSELSSVVQVKLDHHGEQLGDLKVSLVGEPLGNGWRTKPVDARSGPDRMFLAEPGSYQVVVAASRDHWVIESRAECDVGEGQLATVRLPLRRGGGLAMTLHAPGSGPSEPWSTFEIVVEDPGGAERHVFSAVEAMNGNRIQGLRTDERYRIGYVFSQGVYQLVMRVGGFQEWRMPVRIEAGTETHYSVVLSPRD
jgi:hypothetical protein